MSHDSSNLEWGGGGSGDYSFLVNSIEGTISSAVPSDENGLNNSNLRDSSFASTPGASKRSRLSIDNSECRSSARPSYSDSLKSMVEFDELRLANEQLSEQLATCKSESVIIKDKLVKQLTYLEEQNNRLKKESDSRLEKYYEEKKKWQIKLREYEFQNKQAQTASLLSAANNTEPTSSNLAAVSTTSTAEQSASITHRLKQLERDIFVKSKEAKENAQLVIELQNTVANLEQELRLQQSMHPDPESGAASAEETEEVRELRRQLSNVEMSLKRKTRDCEKLEQKAKNQKLLEEEVSSLQARLKLSQESVRSSEAMEASYRKLCDEKNQWKQQFQSIMTSSAAANSSTGGAGLTTAASTSGGDSSSTKEATPVNVLRILAASQERCSVLLKTQGELELKVTGLQSQLTKTQAKYDELDRTSSAAVASANTLTRRNAILTQQKLIYEGEVLSMRSLLETYDTEFSLGRPDLNRMLGLKDERIAALCAEMDKIREAANGYVKTITDLQSSSSSRAPSAGMAVEVPGSGDAAAPAAGATMPVSDHNRAVSALRSEIESLRSEYSALQEVTGMDFVPGKTKVLHLIHNPHAEARASIPNATAIGAATEDQQSTLPMDRLRQLREVVRKQQQELQQLSEAATVAGESVPVAVVMDVVDAKPAEDALNTTTTAGGAAAASGGPSKADLMASIVQSNKVNQRLKEMFRERITAFREAVYLLTGYKIDVYHEEAAAGGAESGSTSAQLKLRSMYAERPDDALLFQWKDDSLELLGTDLTSRLDPKLFTYLNSCNSVPAFLSSVTIDLFESQTFLG